MNAILIAIAWAGAGSGPSSLGASLAELGVAALLTVGVAALARRNELEKKRLSEGKLAAAVPADGIH